SLPERIGIDSNNALVGGQLGVRWRMDHGNFFWQATGKAGMYGNHRTLKFDDALYGQDYGPYTATDSKTAFVGDVDITFGYQLSKNFSVQSGYDAIWISPDTGAFSNQVFLQGFNAGFEVQW